MNRKIVALTLLIIVAVLFFTGFIMYKLVTGDTDDIVDRGNEYPVSIKSDNTETSYIKDLHSDEKTNDEAADMASYVWEVDPMSKEGFASFLLEYDKLIAYKDGGRRYDLSMPTYKAVLSSMGTNEYEGLDSLGFVDWAYRIVTGTSLKNIETPITLYEQSAKVNLDDLQIGDIGMYSKEESGNHFGIFVGKIDGIPVFAHCANIPIRNMQKGCLQFSYLSSVKDKALNDSPAVSFSYFFRPDVEWLQGNDNVELVLIDGKLSIKE